MQYCGIDHKFSWRNTVTPSTQSEKWQVKKYTKLPDINSTIIQRNKSIFVEAKLMADLKKGVVDMRDNESVHEKFDGIFGGDVVPGKHTHALNVYEFSSNAAKNIISLFKKHMLVLDCIGINDNVKSDMINIHVKLHIDQDQPVEFLQRTPHFPMCFRLDLHLNKEKDAKRRKSGTITTTAALVTYIEVQLVYWYNEWTQYKTPFTRIFKNEFNRYDDQWTRRCDLGSSHSLHTCRTPVREINAGFCTAEKQWEGVLCMADGAAKRQHLTTIITELRSLVLGALPVDHRLKATAPPDDVTDYVEAVQLRTAFIEACDAALFAGTSDNDRVNHCRNAANGYRKLVNMGVALAEVLEPVPLVPP